MIDYRGFAANHAILQFQRYQLRHEKVARQQNIGDRTGLLDVVQRVCRQPFRIIMPDGGDAAAIHIGAVFRRHSEVTGEIFQVERL